MPTRRKTWRITRLLIQWLTCGCEHGSGAKGDELSQIHPPCPWRKVSWLLRWRQVQNHLLVVASRERIGGANRVGILWRRPASPVGRSVFKELDGVQYRDDRQLFGHDLRQPLN